MIKRLVAWFLANAKEARQAITSARSEPDETCAPEWYAGLVVSPASFSRQLGEMQISLMRANEAVEKNPGRVSGAMVGQRI